MVSRGGALVSFKSEVYVEGSWSSNACVYAERWEAYKAGSELLSRWYVPTDHRPVACDDAVNYYWDAAAHRGLPLPPLSTQGLAIDSDEYARAVARQDAYAAEIARRDAMVREGLAVACASWSAHVAECTPPAFVEAISVTVAIDALPPHARDAIKRVGYHLRTCTVVVAHDRVVVSSNANDGQIATYVTTARTELETGVPSYHLICESGSWGGPNPFERSSIDAQPIRTIPVGGVIVHALTARNRKSPWLTVHARAVDALAWLARTDDDRTALAVARDAIEESADPGDLRAWTIAYNALGAIGERARADASYGVTPTMRGVLSVYKGIRGGHRTKYLERIGEADAVSSAVEACVQRGLLRRSKSGATQITDAGRDAIAGTDAGMFCV